MGGFMNRKKRDNRGLSLIELIVVVAILGILSVGSISYLGLLSNHSAKETSAKLKSAMTETRTEAMSKSSASLQIYEDDSEYYVKLTVNGNAHQPVKIGSARVKLTYKKSNEPDNTYDVPNVTSTEPLVIEFDRDTGAFKHIGIVGADKVYCKSITVAAGSKTYVLKCERLTGKIIVE